MKKLSPAFKKYLGFTLKLLLAAGILAYLFRNPGEIVAALKRFDFRYLLPAMICYVTHILVCAWRWRELAKVIGVRLTPFEAISLTFQGNMFSMVLPGGAIGGDVIKMSAVTRRSATGSKAEGAFTVLMDRIIGMIALFTLELVLLVFARTRELMMSISVDKMELTPGMKKIGIILLALLAVTGLAASCVIFFHRLIEKIPPLGKLMRWGDRVTHGMVSRLTAATDIYSASWRKLALLVLASSLFVHLMTVVPMYFLLSGLGVDVSSRIFDVVVAVTIGNIVGLIPLLPGGLGGRDVAAITLLAASGVDAPDAKAAQLIYTGIMLLFNLPGVIFMICDPGRAIARVDTENNGAPPKEEH